MKKIEQQIIWLKQISTIMQVLPESTSIRDISKKTGISDGVVQKLLHKPDLIAEALGLNNNPETIKEITKKINDWFEKNKKEGFRRGADINNSMSKHHPTIRSK